MTNKNQISLQFTTRNTLYFLSLGFLLLKITKIFNFYVYKKSCKPKVYLKV